MCIVYVKAYNCCSPAAFEFQTFVNIVVLCMYSVFNPGPHWKPTFVVWATLVKYCGKKKYCSLYYVPRSFLQTSKYHDLSDFNEIMSNVHVFTDLC